MNDRELMQQALDALEEESTYNGALKQALRARLAQLEQEPVAWYEPEFYSNVTIHKKWAKENGWLPLYTAPPQREWQGLTEEERYLNEARSAEEIEYARAIEARLREKNT